MAIVYRNGRPRLQRSKRVGGRVTTEYVASGEVALLFDAMERVIRQKGETDRRQATLKWQEPDEMDEALADLAAQAMAAACDSLERAGYRQHKRGDWRRSRGDRHREA